MTGWHISIYRQTNDGASPAKAESPEGTRLAVWQSGVDGLDWVQELVKADKAINLGGNGYPYRYTATAENLIPQIVAEPPGARRIWASEENNILTQKWEGKTVIDRAALADCRPDEWLLIVVWDES